MLTYFTVPLIMALLMIVTKSYTKSISNAFTIIGLLFFAYAVNYSLDLAFYGLAFIIFAMQIRAIINHNIDTFIKR
jgi:uncharacterized membrane protein YfhO